MMECIQPVVHAFLFLRFVSTYMNNHVHRALLENT